MSRQEAHIVALQATTTALSAQINALTISGGSIVVSKVMNNIASGTGNFYGAGVPTAWDITVNVIGGNQLFIVNFTALTGETGAALMTYELLVDSVSVCQKSVYHSDGGAHLPISMIAVKQLTSGAHTVGVKIPSGSGVGSSDFCDITLVEY